MCDVDSFVLSNARIQDDESGEDFGEEMDKIDDGEDGEDDVDEGSSKKRKVTNSSFS